jgi:hypothetical protein
MTDHDFSSRAAIRRMLWRHGWSTRIGLGLQNNRASDSPAAVAAELDVLGVSVTSEGQTRYSIADCRNTGNAASRLFWLAGIRDLFGAEDVYAVRDRNISQETRQVASRLKVTALTAEEVLSLEGLMSAEPEMRPVRVLFEPRFLAAVGTRLTELDPKLDALLKYRQFGYWIDDEYRPLLRLVDALRSVRTSLDATPVHAGLVMDVAWLYVLSISKAIRELRRAHVADVNLGLSEILAGGAALQRQKRELADILDSLKDSKQIPGRVKISVNPPYFGPLLELVMRLLRRGEMLTDILRVLELTSSTAIVGERLKAEEAFGNEYNRIAAKLAADVVGFLVRSAELDPKILDLSKALLLGSEVGTLSGSGTTPPLFNDEPPSTPAR